MTNYLRAFYYLSSLMRSAYWARDKLLEHQKKQLRRIVKYAYDYVPFYHKTFRQLGLKPSDIRNLKDLNRLPIVRKNEIRKNLDKMISNKFYVKKLQKRSTSGSTGQPLTVFISKDEDYFRKAKHLRANICCGQRPRDRWVTITSPSHFAEVTKFQKTLGYYAPTFLSVFERPARQISIIEKIKPKILDGYSSSLLLLAKEAKRKCIETIKPKVIFGGAELVDNFSRQFIEEAFDAPFYDQYAIVELERLAWQCPEKSGYHIDAETIILQFVNKNGDEVSEGESGEIVCTSLFNYAMPFIRYAVGDIGVPSNEECPCGRTLPLMKVIEGRKDSLLLLPDSRLLSPRALTITMNMFESSRLIEQFRVIQKKTDLFEIWIKKKDDTVDETTIATKLAAHIRKMLKIDKYEISFEIKFVEDIPIDRSGKLRAVVSELSSS